MDWLAILLLWTAQPDELRTVDLTVTNPTGGAKLWAKLFVPKDASAEKKVTAVVVFPGGIGFGSQDRSPMPRDAASRGLAVALFDPDGRGKSGGEEDYGGRIHQDGLLAVVREVRKLDFVEKVGLVSLSFGIAMASGVLGRYPDEPIAFFVDWEGPSDRFYITKNDQVFARNPEIFDGHRASDEEWWKEREAVRYAPQFRCPYLRIQSERDHVHGPDFGHALMMIEAATSARNDGKGRSPWTRVNDNEPNRVYTKEAPPKLLPVGRRKDAFWIRYALELAKK